MKGVRLRTKFQIAMLVVSAGLTAMTLAVVQRTVEARVRGALASDLQDSLANFRNIQAERESNLRATARLMADLPILKALMTSQHPLTIQDGSQQLFDLSEGDLLALMDSSGGLVGLHIRGEQAPHDEIEQIIHANKLEANTTAWWYAGQHLYEVYLEPIYFGSEERKTLLGVLAVGTQMNDAIPGRARKLGASEVVLLMGNQVVASSLKPDQVRRLAAAKVNLTESVSPVDIMLGDEKFLASPIVLDRGQGAQVAALVMKSYDSAIAFLTRLQRILLAIGMLAVLAGSMIVAALARTFTRPLEELAAGVSALGSGDFAFPLASSTGGGEVQELTRAFAEMRSRLAEAQQNLLESERLATIGRMAGSISHDLRHPLTAVLANAEFLADPKLRPSQREELYDEIRLAVNRLTDLIDSLLELSRPLKGLAVASAELDGPLQNAIDLIRTHPQFHQIAIEKRGSEVTALVEPRKIERAFYNLLLNACQAVDPAHGLIQISLQSHMDRAELRFRDNGSGVPDAIRTKLFQPFISMGKQNGTGLGLTIAQKIILDHGGSLELEGSEPGATCFVLTLPRFAKQEAASSSRR